MNLEQWRDTLPPEMSWNENDPPSPDINAAQMRTKYYAARYFIYRPLLYHTLHHCEPNMGPHSIESSVRLPESQQACSVAHGQYVLNIARTARSSTLGAGRLTHTYRDLGRELRQACKVCLDNAVRSTEAFDKIKGRSVVTNIFETAHA